MTMAAATASPSVDTSIEFLGWLHWLWAGFNAAVGVAMAAFAVAALLAGTGRPGVPVTDLAAGVTAGGFLIVAMTALIWSAAHAWCARALHRHDAWGRVGAIGLSLFDALLVPLGTLLAGYTVWLLLQEGVRRRFLVTG